MARKTNLTNEKTTLFWAGVGVLLLVIFIFSFYPLGPSKGELKLVIDYGDGRSRSFLTNYRPGTTAWDMLQQANANYQINLELQSNFQPKAIGEVANGEAKRWGFYVNGRRQSLSPIEVPVSGGEVISFKFE